MKHTKGPWYAIEYGGYISMQSEDWYSDNDLLNIDKDSNAKANGKLMAAAPEMLKCLEDILEIFDPECKDKFWWPDGLSKIIKQADSVIDNATSEKQLA